MGREKNYALTIDTGSNTHITLVYFYNLSGDFVVKDIRQMALDYMRNNGYDRQIKIELGDMWGRRSILVHGEVKQLQEKLIELFQSKGWNIDISDRAFVPHIDPRGQDRKVIVKSVNPYTSLI